ncbi:MAG: poly-gamma-glutamate biosynthesis protein PgsC [Eubacterium sp.]|nr:poly-gamma-glutamate biosynthesis protein PgsC [Eubacterium sp.]
MNITEFYIALLVGLLLSLAIEELFGISCGGVIVAGYLAMVCDDLLSIGVVILISLLTFFIVEYILPRFMLLFGKRKFVACLLFALIFKVISVFFVPTLPFATMAFRGIGVVTPGLIAHTSTKQGIRITIPAVIVATYITFAIVQGLMMLI